MTRPAAARIAGDSRPPAGRRLRPAHWLLLCALALPACGSSTSHPRGMDGDAGTARGQVREARENLRAAMAARDASALAAVVAKARAQLGAKAGEPDVEDDVRPIPADEPLLSAEEARKFAAKSVPRLASLRWWRIGVDPVSLDRPLREPADVIEGAVALARAAPDQAAQALAIARDAGEFLLWAQNQAGDGLCPFPASRGRSDSAPFRASAGFLAEAERTGRLSSVVHAGWVVDDLGDGGLQFDNAACGEALLSLYDATGEARWLDAVRRMGDWAMTRPLSTNWNYNAFSVQLLADLHRVTGEPRYLASALDKARFGVLPGQLRDGPRAGRWLDPHNARPAYHYIMLGALATLAHELRDDPQARAEVEASLERGLKARNPDFATRGATTKDHALQTLLLVERLYADAPDFRARTATDSAFAALERLAARDLRAGGSPLGPHALGALLADAVARTSATPAEPGTAD